MARIFISYSRADSLFISELVPLLAKVFSSHVIWYDEHITGGEDWWQRILHEIDTSDLFIYLLSNDSISSKYCQAEFREALRLQKQCLPVIVRARTDVDKAPDDLKGEIRRRNWIDMSGGVQDARANAALYASITSLLGQIPAQPPIPLVPTPISQPEVGLTANRGSKPPGRIPLIVAMIGGVVIIAALLGIVPPLLNALKGQPATPTLATTGVAANLSTATLSLSAPPTATLTATVVTLTASPIPTVAANKDWTPQTRMFDAVEMVLVPPGCFMMGTDKPPTSYNEDQMPSSKQCFDAPFWIDKTEVTQAQFKKFGGHAANTPAFRGDNRPVEQITWFEARDFCAKRGARLPTEAEWEYAARGPDALVYPWGNIFNGKNLVYAANSGDQTAIVGSKVGGASWIGALDMSGNVWEWVNSIYEPYPYDKADGRENKDDTESKRALRGGSWGDDTDLGFLDAANRLSYVPSSEGDSSGFRCARSF